MKKTLLLFSIVLIVVLMVVVLFFRKAQVASKVQSTRNNVTSVNVTQVKRESLSAGITKVGTIVANNVVNVQSETSGKIVAVYVNVGSYVKAGAPLAKADDETLRAKYLSAQVAYEKAKKDFERDQELYKTQIVSGSDLESSRETMQSEEADYITAKYNYNHAVISAPISGLVTNRAVDIGSMVLSGTAVATVIDNSTFKVDVDVTEEEAYQIKVGDPVVITATVYPGVNFHGRVSTISSKASDAHTIPIEVQFTPPQGYAVKSGIFGTVAFQLGTPSVVLAVPRDAIVSSMKEPQVYVVEGNVAKLRNIVVGSEYGTKLEVLQGLKENEKVVTAGQDYLRDNVMVNVINAQ
jgi:membrane fusion protein, multidrug efflux system